EEGWESERDDARPMVTEEDIAEVVSMWTGIPLARIASEESARLLQMEAGLHSKGIGQDDAITPLPRSPRRARARPDDPSPAPADRRVHVPRPHRRRQDVAGAGTGRVHVWLRGRHDQARHERVHGKAHGSPPGRGAARLHRLRRRRPAHGYGAA